MAVVALISCVILITLPTASHATNVTVQTSSGTVRGTKVSVTTVGADLDVFLGIPYAEPPVGSRRFRAPVAKANWEGTIDAVERPSSCFQSVHPPPFDIGNPNTELSEDCLYLNVWSPSTESDSPRAVMVWIHGGGFNTGTSTLDLYDGSILSARNDVVVVSMQYRLNIFGFLYLGTEKAPGNMGLMDQQMALKWVKNNIEFFGGDPARVTLFGQSAGAASVQYHMFSLGSKGLFNNVILESGSALAEWGFISKENATMQANAVMESVGCSSDDSYNCLMSKDAQTLSTAVDIPTASYVYLPIADGQFIRNPPRELLQNGEFEMVNVLTGTNRDEGTYSIAIEMTTSYSQFIISRLSYNLVVGFLFESYKPEILEEVNREYEVPALNATSDHFLKALNGLTTDIQFVCPQKESIEAFVENGMVVYEYLYAHAAGSYSPDWMGVTHSMEIDDVFGINLVNGSEGDKKLSEVMMDYWTNFAKTGNPNQDGDESLPQWRPHTKSEHYHMLLQTPDVSLIDNYRPNRCKFIEQLMAKAKAVDDKKEETSRGSKLSVAWITMSWAIMVASREV